MNNNTRILLNQYITDVAKLSGVDLTPGAGTYQFSVTPSVQQKLETRIQQSSQFLQQINNEIVTEQMGSKLGLGIGSTIASTTDTTKADRVPTDPTTLDESGYICTQTNFDTLLRYGKLDMWAKYADFQTRIRDAILKRQALDVIMIGFNGIERAATSDRIANPLLQDVNIGWLEKIRKYAAPRVMKEGKTAGKVIVGKEGDYANLDALVMDAVYQMIDPWYREDTQLVAILGSDMMQDKYFPLINDNSLPTERLAADMIISQKRVGGKQGVTVPFVPAGSILVTRLDNLSRYTQEGGRRRTIIDNARRDQVEFFESSNDAYVVEDYGCTCLIENIQIV